MIINPICPKCNYELKVNVKKIDKLQSLIIDLQQENKALRAAYKTLKNGGYGSYKDNAIDSLMRQFGL